MLQRIHIIGTSGTGKTTLGRRLGELLQVPVFHLDDIARIGGGRGVRRPIEDRDARVDEIVATSSWVVEGVHIGWTSPLLAQAQVIVWLDNVTPTVAQTRIVRRFVSRAIFEVRHRRGRDRFLRVRDYIRELRGLMAHLRTIGGLSRVEKLSDADSETQTAIELALLPLTDRVIRCTDQTSVEALVAYLMIETPLDSSRGP